MQLNTHYKTIALPLDGSYWTWADHQSVPSITDRLKCLDLHAPTAYSINPILDDWSKRGLASRPLGRLKQVLNDTRKIPRGDERVHAMSTFVRLLGKPENFAELLDILRLSATADDPEEVALTEYSRMDDKHSSYGWCGQTRLICSDSNMDPATTKPVDGVQEILGKAPVSRWSLSMHIWQPNPNARGFKAVNQLNNDSIYEPPHSHPFDFASNVVCGSLQQSFYTTIADGSLLERSRYHPETLVHVHGVWPPHDVLESETLYVADTLHLEAGDCYFLPSHVIHDVEISRSTSRKTPAITLFLRSEAYLKPHVHMVKAMHDYHTLNSSIEHRGKRMLERDWNEKLTRVAQYVRHSGELVLDDVVKEDSEYAFFHV